MYNSFAQTSIPNDWEARPLNDRKYYLDSPAHVFATNKGHLDN